jgi:folate-binding protein YgfZ
MVRSAGCRPRQNFSGQKAPLSGEAWVHGGTHSALVHPATRRSHKEPPDEFAQGFAESAKASPQLRLFEMSELHMTGYSALRERAAWIDLSGRGKIRLTGEDRGRLLHAMTTQHIQQMRPGEGAYAFFLNAQGRILGDVNVFCFADHFLLDTEPETRAKLYEHLDRYIIADDVTIEDATDQLATVAVEGPEAAAALEALGATLPTDDYATSAWGDITVARVSSTGVGGFFLFVPTAAKADFLQRLAAVPQTSNDDARVVRIEHGRPRYGEEITERYLVQETGQMHGIHFTKGCYLGQEIVERVRSRAQIHRVLRRLEIVPLDSRQPVSKALAPPEPGTKLKSGDAEAAEIASAVYSPALGKIVALAYVRTPFAGPGTEILTGEYKIEVRA